eukprot:460161-Hanusia_phi.AAC.1
MPRRWQQAFPPGPRGSPPAAATATATGGAVRPLAGRRSCGPVRGRRVDLGRGRGGGGENEAGGPAGGGSESSRCPRVAGR